MIQTVDKYALDKIRFVSDLNGTDLVDLTLFFTTVPLVTFFSFLFKLLIIYKFSVDSRTMSKFLIFTGDFLLCCLPLVLISTVLCNSLTQIQFAYTLSIFIIYKALFYGKSNPETIQSPSQTIDTAYIYRDQILSLTFKLFRVTVYTLTAISILAVDFQIFPRRFAKTETYGVSLMDIGVGAFVASHAFKATKANYNKKPNEHFDPIEDLKGLTAKFQNTIKSSSILIIMGLLRLISVKSTNYVEHITEYGLHWNFFFTLAIVKILSCPFNVYTRNSPLRAFMLSFMFGTAYQYLLSRNGYSNYILNEPLTSQSTLLQANKEGLFSCLGYFSIYFAAQSVSIYLSLKVREKTTNLYTPFLKSLSYLLFVTSFYFLALQSSRIFIEDVSRRLCNISFVCFTLMYSTLLLTLQLCTVLFISVSCTRLNKLSKQKICQPWTSNADFVFSFINILDSKFVGLFMFIVANILTGLINLSINTLHTSNKHASIILLAYMVVVTLSSYYFYFYSALRFLPSQKLE